MFGELGVSPVLACNMHIHVSIEGYIRLLGQQPLHGSMCDHYSHTLLAVFLLVSFVR